MLRECRAARRATHARGMRAERAAIDGGRGRAARARARAALGLVARRPRQQVERVVAQAAAQRLQRDHVVGGDVAEVDVRADVAQQPRLLACAAAPRRSPSRDRPRARSRSTSSAWTAPLGSNSPTVPLSRPSAMTQRRAGREVAEHLGAPRVGVRGRGALAADLGDHGELLRELRDELRLLRRRHRQRAVGDLDVVDPELAQPVDVALELALVRRRSRAACRRGRARCRRRGRSRPCRRRRRSRTPCPSPSLIRSMCAPAVISSDSSASGDRPRSSTCVMPARRGFSVRSGRSRKSGRRLSSRGAEAGTPSSRSDRSSMALPAHGKRIPEAGPAGERGAEAGQPAST